MAEAKVCIAGLGAIGGFVGAAIARKGPVYFYARGKKMEHIAKHGVSVISPMTGDFVAYPTAISSDASALGVMDTIFLCVKGYALEALLPSIAPMVGKDTVIVTLMNGISNGDVVRGAFPQNMVFDSAVYVVANYENGLVVRHNGKDCTVVIGTKENDERHENAMLEVQKLLTDAGVNCQIAEDIDIAIWKKYILNCAFNVSTVYYDGSVGTFRDDPVKAEAYFGLLEEAFAIAEAHGVNLEDDLLEQYRARLKNYTDDSTSSMHHDAQEGRPMELEAFSGTLLRLAERYGLELPVTKMMYTEIKKRIDAQA